MNPNRTSTTVPNEGWFEHLRPRGLQPVWVSDRWGPFCDWSHNQGIPTYEISLPEPNRLNPWPLAASLWRLRSIVKRHHIELIHCNEQNIYPISSYLSRYCRIPVVVSVHWPMTREHCEWAFAGKRRPNRIFFVSESCQQLSGNNLPQLIPLADQVILYNGLQLANYSTDPEQGQAFRQQWGIATSDQVLGVACALRPIKQIEHLIEVAVKLQTPNVKVLLAGGPIKGHEAYAETLLSTAHEKLGNRFQHVGKLSSIGAFCNALEIFVNTSGGESFGIAALEALACGTPVIGYPSNSVIEVVLPDGGQIVPQDDVSALRKAIDGALADRGRLAVMRTLARRQAERFDIATIADQLWNEYSAVLAQPKYTSPPGFTPS